MPLAGPGWWRRLRRLVLLAGLAATLLAGCGGGHDDRGTAARAAPAAAAATTSATPPDASELMDWAEQRYPTLFPGPQPNRRELAYTYRHYPATGNYLGVAGIGIYLLGPVSGHAAAPVQVGTLDQYTCLVFPGRCDTSAVDKPLGTYASAPGSTIYGHAQLRGVLLRASWSSLEPAPGQFDFSALERQLAAVRAAGKPWSLAVGAGGPGSPAWLMDTLGAPSIDYRFRGTTPYRLPLAWDPVVQQRLAQLAERLAQQYGGDAALKLVYVPQMSANGIEGHLNGVDMAVMQRAGYSDERWVQASTQTATAFARAFATKALAFEVHEIDGSASVPSRILDALWTDPALGRRVGAAIWWLSGRTDYQAALIQVLTDFPGDKYGQAIGRSDQGDRFGNGDYRTVFAQARQIGLRYLEPWEYDFGSGANTANGAWDAELKGFNDWAGLHFGRATTQAAGPARAGRSTR